MATIRSQMVLNDGISGVLRKINTALNTTLNAFEQVQRASGRAVDTAQIQAARAALVQANREVDEMAEGYRRAAEQEEVLNKGLRNGTNAAGGLLGKVKGIVATLAAGAGIKALLGLSDKMTSTTARLNFLVDDGGSVEALEQKIMASAQRSRSAYLDTASAIASMGANAGSAFESNDELIAFMEQINKQFVIGGATAEGQSAAMLQLTQAMAAGALRGEELNSILENAPGIARAIESYMGVAEGSIKQYAEQGLITAEVVKNAMFAAADETNAKFESMPMTWGQVWTLMGNVALQALNPVLTGVNWIANNIDIIGPLVLGVAGAFAVYAAAVRGVALATKVWTEARKALNAVMALNPVFLIIMGVVLLIAAIYAVVAAVNKATGSSISATGLICGAIAVAGAFIGNTVIGLLNALIQYIWAIFVAPFLGIVEWILNVCNGGFNSFGDAVANLIGQIIGWFLNLGKVVTTIIDAIFGTNWTAGLESLQSSVTAWGKNENAITLDKNAPTIDYRFEYGDAWAAGNDFGKGIDAKIGGMFNTGGLGDSSGFDLGDIAAYTGETAANTGAAADALSTSTEELEYLRDIAERDAINRFTTAEVRIDMTGMTNRIEGGADLDGVISTLTDGFTEALLTAAEGVHA